MQLWPFIWIVDIPHWTYNQLLFSGTPNGPENVELTLVNDEKDLHIGWTVIEDVLRPIGSFYISLSAADITRRQVETDRSNFTTQETFYVIPNIDQGKQFTLQVCSQNEFGFNCSTPITFRARDLKIIVATEPLEPQPTEPQPTGLAPGIIALIVIILLLCCLILLVLILYLYLRKKKGKSYYPREKGKKILQISYRNICLYLVCLYIHLQKERTHKSFHSKCLL